MMYSGHGLAGMMICVNDTAPAFMSRYYFDSIRDVYMYYQGEFIVSALSFCQGG